MALDKDTVARIARLARLKVPDEELGTLAGELSGIFAWIEQLNEVDTRNIEPLSSVSDVTLPMRADKVTDGGIAAKVLANAPGGAVYIDSSDKNAGGFFTVPKVVE
ncbi:MAG: Asp-tRNA(Asn)/Glu-tRNA(Gln) amidotransferase subunit GatC [Reyranella sp.]|nr:Asp-tRNA(Asn)/Glu-tRNA(Gln) amidotransferase subunit GatC [Reyranella sp.]